MLYLRRRINVLEDLTSDEMILMSNKITPVVVVGKELRCHLAYAQLSYIWLISWYEKRKMIGFQKIRLWRSKSNANMFAKLEKHLGNKIPVFGRYQNWPDADRETRFTQLF